MKSVWAGSCKKNHSGEGKNHGEFRVRRNDLFKANPSQLK